MPNYGLVVTPTYNPMSYEQYIQPFREYAQVYNATMDQIDALEMEANQWERLADSDIDAPQYQQYKSYADDLRKYANEIATQGLSSRTRAGLSRMRQRYAKEIKPIEDAFNRRQEAIKAEDALLAKDPSLVLAGSARNIGLGQYMAGTPQVYGVSGNDVYSKTLAAFQAISKRKVNFDEARRFGGAYYSLVKEVGEDNPQAVLGILQNMLEDPEIARDPEKLNEVQGLTEYAQAVNSVLESTHYNKLSTEGKDRILQSAIAGGITGMVFDRDEHLYQDPYAAALAARRAQEQPIQTVPAVSTSFVRGQYGEPKDAVKVRQELNTVRQEAQSPWNNPKSYGDLHKDSPLKRDFNSPTEALVWSDNILSQIDSALNGASILGISASDPNDSKTWQINGKDLTTSQLVHAYKDANKIKDILKNYEDKVMPYFRTLQIDGNKFATDEQLAQISQIQHNVGSMQSINHSIDSTSEEDRKAKKARYDQIVKGAKNFEKENVNSRGLYEIDEKTGKLTKITDEEKYDKITDSNKGELVYNTRYGLVIQSGDKLYLPKNESSVDSFNTSNTAILQALHFDDSLYALESNMLRNQEIPSELGNLNYDYRESQYHPERPTVVYQDRNITIYEGVGKGGNVERVIADNATGSVITVISATEAANANGFLASGEYQRGINTWWKHAKALTTIANDKL